MIGTFAYCLLILALFALDRDKRVRTSLALWIPVVWFSLACSRSVALWMNTPPVGAAWEILEGSPVDRLVFTGLLVVGLIVLVSRAQRVGEFLQPNAVILLFFLYCLVSSLLWSDYPDVAFKRWLKALGDLVMVLIVLSDREPIGALKRLFARVSYLLIPLSVLFIKYYPNLGRGYGIWGGEAYYTGITTNKNTLGVICLLFGLGTLWRFRTVYQDRNSEGRIKKLITYSVVLGMVFWLLRMANSMTSLSCFLLASILLVLLNSRTFIKRPILVHFLIATMIVAPVAVLFLGMTPGALETMGRDSTFTGRTEVWGVLLNMVQNPLLGTGFESFWLGSRLEKLWSMYWWRPSEAHNGYLEVFLNLGWIGVALLVVVLVKGYRTVFRAWRSGVSTGDLRLAIFFTGIVYNFTEAAFFQMMAPAWIFFLLATTRMPSEVILEKPINHAKLVLRPPLSGQEPSSSDLEAEVALSRFR